MHIKYKIHKITASFNNAKEFVYVTFLGCFIASSIKIYLIDYKRVYQ